LEIPHSLTKTTAAHYGERKKENGFSLFSFRLSPALAGGGVELFSCLITNH
jgi:hypothetical protein